MHLDTKLHTYVLKCYHGDQNVHILKYTDDNQECILFKLSRGLLDDASYQIYKALGLVVSDKKICSCFSLY